MKMTESQETLAGGIINETVPGEQFFALKNYERGKDFITKDTMTSAQFEYLKPQHFQETAMEPKTQARNSSAIEPVVVIDSFRNTKPTEPSPLMGEHLFTNDHDQELELPEEAESGQEGMSSEKIRLEVIRKIQNLVQDEEIYLEFQLYLDEREVERQRICEQRQMLQQQALNEDNRIDIHLDAQELNFPEDYATEDLYSVYNRLYSHAMYQKRARAE